MAGLNDSLEKLAAAWEAIPGGRRAEAGEWFTTSAVAIVKGLGVLGDSVKSIEGPLIALMFQAGQEVFIWQRSWETVIERIGARFPAMAATMQALVAPAAPPPAPPPPPPIPPDAR
jgi:hypothetical protein